MTPFIQFCLSYSDVIHLEADAHHFWCGEVDKDLCPTCPNQPKGGATCNTFTSAELDYLISNHPELLV